MEVFAFELYVAVFCTASIAVATLGQAQQRPDTAISEHPPRCKQE
jgi:hypothetical protein